MGVWGAASFIAAFAEDWEQRHFVDLALALWCSGAVIAAVACCWRRGWHLAAASSLGTLLLTPLVPILLAWTFFEWEFNNTILPGGIYAIVEGVLTDPRPWWRGPSEIIGWGSWCVALGWALSGLLLLPYQWLAARASSLPSNRQD